MEASQNMPDSTIESILRVIDESSLNQRTKSEVISRIKMPDVKDMLARRVERIYILAPEIYDRWAFTTSDEVMDYIVPVLHESRVKPKTGRKLHEKIYHALGGKEPLEY